MAYASQGATLLYLNPTKYAALAGVRGISGPGITLNSLDVTDLSHQQRQRIPDIPDNAEVTFDLLFDPGDTSNAAFVADVTDGTAITAKIYWPSEGNTATIASINTSNEQVTVTGHGLTSGMAVRLLTTGTLPTSSPQVALGATYFVSTASVDAFTMHTSNAAAVAGTDAINFSAAGSGNKIAKGNVWSFSGIVTECNPNNRVAEALSASLTVAVAGSITPT